MEALAAQGNTAEALRVYDDLRCRLRDELGTAPGAECRGCTSSSSDRAPAPPGHMRPASDVSPTIVKRRAASLRER